jgi:type III restriction enzyme
MSSAPLQFARDISAKVNASWESGEFLSSVSETTKNLLRHWLHEEYAGLRTLNFHEGQRQSILNTIYIHEVLKSKNIGDVYQTISPDLLLGDVGLSTMMQQKYSHPKYCIKMATGTGKTWVLEALLIWQYLNSKDEESGNFSKNFLLVAPGLIVYERLLDAFLGKEIENGQGRNFETSDIYACRDLFLPEEYRETMFGFMKSSVLKKDEIGTKIVGDGLIAITNWHLLAGVDEGVDVTSLGGDIDTGALIDDILPARPSKSAGNDLTALDNEYGKGRALDYLRDLSDLIVFNDEAHHIHEVKKAGEVNEVEWQKSLIAIAETKGERFTQIDFSATPYNEQGKTKQFFPHIIVDFDVKAAIQKGLVKTLVLDRRVEVAAQELDFKAERDEDGKVIGLSEGQRLMLRAGLQKLRILERDFDAIAERHDKYPKMLVVCEDTEVVPFVSEFLHASEGLTDMDVLEVHSNKKGEVTADEWKALKSRLFNLDRHASPKVVISVLMLREGFDVNNICVIVPLRSSKAQILLEQTIGRGLRLMWREPEFTEIKSENRRKMLVEKRDPDNYLDILSIVEHPAFLAFYDELMKDGLVGFDGRDLGSVGSDQITGDIVTVGLRAGYEKFDFEFPVITQESEEVMKSQVLSIESLRPYPNFTLAQLKKMVPESERFHSQEVTRGARFGDYSVHGGVMSATSYNDYVSRLVNRVSVLLSEPISGKHLKSQTKFPMMQVQLPKLAGLTDTYIRTRLFNQVIEPLEGNTWRILLIEDVAQYIIKQVAQYIMKLQETESVGSAEVIHRKISEVESLRMRQLHSLETARTIYQRTPYPSVKGGFEKAFIEYLDTDSTVEAYVKLLQYAQTFIRFRYAKEDGMVAYYYPDFLVRCSNGTSYIVETKSEDQLSHGNVRRKQKAVLAWVDRINALQPELRSGASWQYVLLGESFFYDWRNKGGSIQDMLEYAKIREQGVDGRLL